MNTRQIAFVVLLPVFFASACSRDAIESPVAEAAQTSTVPVSNSQWLATALHCGDADFLRLALDEQKTRMEQDPRWRCESIETHDGTQLNCRPTEPQNVFDSRVFEVSFNHPGGAHQMFLHVQNDAETIINAASRIWALEFDEANNNLPLSQDAGMALRVDEDNGNDNMSSISCSINPGSNTKPALPSNWQSAPVAMPVSKTFASDIESDEGVAILKGQSLLNGLGKCEADHWRSLDFTARRKALEAAGAKCTELKAEGMFKADCTFPAGLISFGNLPVSQFYIRDTGDTHESSIMIRARPQALATAMQADTMTELSPYPGSAGMYQNLLDERYQYIVFASTDENSSELVCRMSEVANNVAGQ
jgi:hypothetical protein